MAKAQTFSDKIKKKKTDTRVNVKVISGHRTEKGTMRYFERFITVDDTNELDKIEIK